MATPAKIQHQARLNQAKVTRKQNRPFGNYDHSEFQWGVVASINPGPPATVDLYLNGSQNNPEDNLTPNVKYLDNYTPNVGDVVLVYRGSGKSRSSRVVLSNLGGSATPFQVLLGSIDPVSRRSIQGPNALWGGVGLPLSELGINGDYYFRTDQAGVAGEQIFQKVAGQWVALVTPLAALNLGATTGFGLLPSMAGAPTGVPVVKPGQIATVVDTAHGRLWMYYGSAWHYTTLT